MTRIDGWENKLETYFLSRKDTPFIWGKTDCCMFVADAIKAITEVDVGEYFRDKYTKILPAYALMKAYSNGGSLQETWERIASDNKMKQVYNKDMLPGDIVTMKLEGYCNPLAGRLSNGITVGIQSFAEGVLCQGKEGLVLSLKPEIVSSWKI